MFSLCLRGFPLGTLVSFPQSKDMQVGRLKTLNCP
uniref:Uncharacterized protein n=1 Tax=Anguilla anguilla TaxID=7936 RepID=A0A0E9SEY8_ANGAN